MIMNGSSHGSEVAAAALTDEGRTSRKRKPSVNGPLRPDLDHDGIAEERQVDIDDDSPPIVAAAKIRSHSLTNGGSPPLKRRLKEENYIAQGGAIASFISQKYMPTRFCRTPTETSACEPSLEILEQPRARGFRFRYPCEGPCHGELRGESSEARLKTYPAVKLHGVQTRARILVSLVCHDDPIRPHAHCLVGRNVHAGQCRVEVGKETDWTAQFPRLSILHIPKKNAARVLLERYALMKDLSATWQDSQHKDMFGGASKLEDAQQERSKYDDKMALELQLLPGAREQLRGGAAALSTLDDEDRHQLEECAAEQARTMNLNVVRLCFQAFLPDESGKFTRRLEPKLSHPVYDTKASSSSALRICRLDRHSGSTLGGDEIFMLCDKVQKDDIAIRFFEERSPENSKANGSADSDYQWEADGEFSASDVHRQSAIVFKTPPYWKSNITRPVKVWLALKRRSEDEHGEPHPFTYLPLDACVCSCRNGKSAAVAAAGSMSMAAAAAAQLASPTAQLTKSLSVPNVLSPVATGITGGNDRASGIPTSILSHSMPHSIAMPTHTAMGSPVVAAPHAGPPQPNGMYYIYTGGMHPGNAAMALPASRVPTSPYATMPSIGMPFFPSMTMVAGCNGTGSLMPAAIPAAHTQN
eukprot:scpid42065/ scgid23675/ Nuclear factor NF-kappa-B p105 subunit; Nuclear factor of kappa light polypeptide gene enhancer in B-cells 1; Nuclear factor NF-kappa-B p50 subunit